MDCYIVRVYRHITRNDGEAGEIAGLVERVGNDDNGKPFSTYNGLVDALRSAYQADDTAQAEKETGLEHVLPDRKSMLGR